jgi:hypothetical protein
MSARRLLLGEHGDIGYREHGGKVTASLYYRNHQGRRRRIEATGSSRTAARRAALASLERALASGGVGDYSPRTTFALWRRAVGRRRLLCCIAASSICMFHRDLGGCDFRSSRSRASINSCMRSAAEPGTPLRRHAGRWRRVCVPLPCVAMRCGQTQRDVTPLEMAEGAKEARALTAEECKEWVAILDVDEYAKRKDLPDLVRFLLGTGCRLGEALGAR